MTDNDVLDIVLNNTLGLADEPPSAANEFKQSPLHRFEMLVQHGVKKMRAERELAMISKRGRGAYCECLFHRTGDFVVAYESALAIMRANGEIV